MSDSVPFRSRWLPLLKVKSFLNVDTFVNFELKLEFYLICLTCGPTFSVKLRSQIENQEIHYRLRFSNNFTSFILKIHIHCITISIYILYEMIRFISKEEN